MKTVKFYYDFASPTAFLAYHQLKKITDRQGAKISYKPILLGALHQATGNSPPGLVPNKGTWMLQHDLPLFSKRYGIELVFNPHFPINCIKALRGSIFLEGTDQEELYRETIFNAVWQQEKNIGDMEVFEKILSAAEFDAQAILNGIEQESVKEKLKALTNEAAERGAFGAPTFYIGDQMFFGQDRLDFIEEALAKNQNG